MTKVAAVDLGATSGRVMLAGLDGGIPWLSEVARFPNGPVHDNGVWAWDVTRLFDEAVRGVATATREGARSWGVDGWAVDYGVIDAGGDLVGPVVSYRDPRHHEGHARVRALIGRAEHYAICGIQDLPFNTANQLLADDPPRLVPGNRLLLVPDLFAHWATGTVAADVTNASTTDLVDVRTRTWSATVLDALGLAADCFPEVVEPGTVRGPATDPRILGLPLVGVATHDTASAFVGAPLADRDEALLLSLGTWAVVGYEAVGARPTEAGRAIDASHELGADGTVRVLRNAPGMWLLEECRRSWRERGQDCGYPDLLAEAAQAPPLALALDLEAPGLATPGQSELTIQAHAVGRWSGSRGSIVRAVLESMVAGIAGRIDGLEDLGGRPRRVLHVVGGGSRMPMVMQWLADATGKVVVAGPAEASALGNAAIQWLAAGDVPSVADCRSRIAAMPEILTYRPTADRERWLRFAQRIEVTA